MNFRQLAYGLLSYVPGIPDWLYRGTGGTDSAEYCYCIWLRHLVLARNAGMQGFPRVVAELGPGDSIGVGLAALLSGAQRYVALDAMTHVQSAQTVEIFDVLVSMFRSRMAIPGMDTFPEIGLELDDRAFPSEILSEAQLDISLATDRVAYLRKIVTGEIHEPSVLDYRAPWGSVRADEESTIDLLLSNAVMEHVSDITGTYRAIDAWLRPGGISTNQIDFRSHGLFRAWDGHWGCPDWLWRLFVGRRLYLLNREPFATHRVASSMAGLKELSAIRIERLPVTQQLAARFVNMSDEDRATCGAYLALRKPPNSDGKAD